MPDRKLVTAEVAELVNCKPATWRGYVSRGQAPKPDGHYGTRVGWWWESTIRDWMKNRPRAQHRNGSRPMTDTDEIAGILAATEEADMPRVTATFEYPDVGTVSVVECVHGGDDGVRRGYLWHAVAGEFVLSPTRRGDVDPDRWVPGGAQLLPGGWLVATSAKSSQQAVANARQVLRKQAEGSRG